MTLTERIEALKRAQAQLPDVLADIAQTATLRAIEKAAELTPPTGDDLSGTHTRTGSMKSRWRADSKVDPSREGARLITVLENRAGESEGSENDTSYASYVNDGHRMDRHFVPGLYVDPDSGLLEYDPAAKVGLVVGTKTPYVPGLHMVDAAKEEYRRVLRVELQKLEEILK